MDTKKTIPINPNILQKITCVNCDSEIFEQKFLVKRLPALQSPTGKEQIVNLPVFICENCKHIFGQPKKEI